ncbi:hypothetical protein ASE01_15665 [Nocardioides sp. Root190]|uniref:hypothetical protein n=1 Tax=Nocardioides sp. Root190 TaxID=1736488 RepID=UPI0006FAAF24|nr:hypothetical protein [Nocardioides sp. Root190]KRB76406.1 hypothetical protein ASE01_15665 [Nocardioides sp. Root190]
MTEPTEPDAPLDAPMDPAREAAVRRLLAEAGGPEPLPDEVAARLDAGLADLVAERSALPIVSHPESHGVVVPLDAAARRRRVRVRVLLGAAAAVVAVGVGAGAVGGGLGQSGSDDVSAANEMAEEDPARSEGGGEADDSAATLDEGQENAEAPEAEPTPDAGDLFDAPRRVVSDGPLREVRATQLREDLVALQHATLPRPTSADYSTATLTAPSDFRCEPAAFGLGYLVGVEYSGMPAVVAFREPVGSTQAAEVIACGSGDVLHSTTLPATG